MRKPPSATRRRRAALRGGGGGGYGARLFMQEAVGRLWDSLSRTHAIWNGKSLVNQCEVDNTAWRTEARMLQQRREVTRAAMCDTQPPCLTELLFTHEFWSGSSETRSRCRSRKYDSDWPTVEPHVNRRKQRPRPRSFWETMRLLPNKTLWLHGDSVQTQLCDAALCSLLRADALPWPALHRPQWLQALELESGLSMRLTQRMPNGAALLCSAFGPHKTEQVDAVLPHVDAVVMNHGLHYHSVAAVGAMLRAALAQLGAWRAGGAGRLALWRETSAQHFAGGAYSAGAARPPPGTPCACVRAPSDASGSSDLNVVSARLEREIAPAHGVVLVPFSNLTRARHDMHRAHFCSYHGQRRVGICCDCTHFCYSPLFWDAAFGGLLLALRQALLQDLRQARQGVHGAPRGLRAVAPAARGSGADAVAGARAREWLSL
mmetsp:Transcript_3922/g.7631  ORF Transcript_3922/g.7631 Transcript_3922/m.7631 type:complete len:433 (-) Transcript_3922:30-1328(-)